MSGFADIHAHPMAHLAFGGRLIWGSPTGAYEEAFHTCDGWDHGAYSRFLGNDIAKAVLDGIIQGERESSWMWQTWPGLSDHPRDGYPTFRGWPFPGSMIHQQLHLIWLHRAYSHGLRLFSALAVNNRALAWLMGNGNECWDDETIRVQVAALQELAQHPFAQPWLEIAYSANDAERIIGENKLAIILGAEVDQIELLLSHDPKVLALLNCEAEAFLSGGVSTAPNIERLAQTIYDIGLRQINPLHFANNSFGGSAFYLDRHAGNTRWLNLWREGRPNGSYWPEICSSDEDLEFRFQRNQTSVNRGWTIFDWPITGSASAYPYAAKNHVNSLGLNAAGVVFIWNLWRRGIMVDVDHMSMKSKNEALQLAEQFGVPVISSHCWIRHITLSRSAIGMPDDWWQKWSGGGPQSSQPTWPMLRHEGMRTRTDLHRIAALGGMIGTLLRQPAVEKPASLTAVTADGVELMGTTTAAAAAYLAVVEELGPASAVAIGSDVNGLAQLPAASYCCLDDAPDPYGPNGINRAVTGDRVWDINADGVAHYGMIPDLIQRWRAEGMSQAQLAPLFRSAEGYVKTWSLVEKAAPRVAAKPPNSYNLRPTPTYEEKRLS